MSLNPDIRDQAYQFFIEEAQELLQVLEDGLLNLREDHSTNKVHELMRAAHSIKGGAASVELEAIKLLAHRLEDYFKALYSDRVEFNEELESLFLQGYDCLRHPLTEQMETGSFDEEAALLTAEPIFTALETLLGDALQEGDNYIPSANDLGVDIVASIFEVDVAQSLDRLAQVLATPENYEVSGELRAQLEVFAGFAELFNLSGFSQIIQIAQTALDSYPDRALEILRVAHADLMASKEAVLAGDRDRGGEPSQALITLANSAATEGQLGTDTEVVSDDLAFNDADNIFAGTADTDSLWSISSVAEPWAETAPEVDDVFGTIPDDETVSETEVENSEAEPWAETTAEVDDVFGTIPDDETDESAFAAISDDVDPNDPSLSEIFAQIPISSERQPAISEPLANQENVSDIDESPADDEDIDVDEMFGIDREIVRSDIPTPQNMEAAVDSIEEIFESLPTVESIPSALSFSEEKRHPDSSPAQATPKSAPATPQSKSKKAVTNLSVRVDLDRLERMNNLIGELTINRNSLALQNQQLQDNVDELVKKFFRFREVTKRLQEVSDKMLIESEKERVILPQQLGEITGRSSAWGFPRLTPTHLNSEFDSLEMDSYSSLYSALQGVLEEVVQLEEGVDDIAIFAKQSDRTIDIQRQMLGQMRDELMWVRMLPLEQIVQRFPRTLRDMSRKYQKPVDLNLNGTEVLLDKAVLEKLQDPLLHLLRNSFDHGIEAPEIRAQAGKPETGSIEINAYYQGNQTVIEVKDDGQGLDLTKIANKAINKGLLSAEQAAVASKEELFNLIFEPGFSTANQVSELSGRGVGMSVVRSQVEFLKGKITVVSTRGQGTTFTLRLPLTLTIAKLLVCSLGSTAFAIPSDSIEEIIIPTSAQIKFSGQQKFLLWGNRLVSVYPLKQVLEYNCTIPHTGLSSKAFETIAAPQDWALPLLLLRRGQQLFALEVENLISEQELVIKPFSKAIAAPKYTYGCTILGDGTLVPAIDGATLLEEILGEAAYSSTANIDSAIDINSLTDSAMESESIESTGSSAQSTTGNKLLTIMVVDDSTALRRTMSLSLEKQGYRIIQSKDGKEAIDNFAKNPEIDLIICDVEMPTMNGFEFLGMRRRDSQLGKVPVVMLTSRSGAKHRNLAMQLGANGYFTKPYIEQDFLVEINKILTNKNKALTQSTSKITQKKTNQTILIIDDSSALRRTLALCLEKKGYRVLQARDGGEGLDILKQNLQTTLVICDVEMPNVNGFEFLTARRDEPQLTQIPVAMLTSRSSDKHRTLAKSLGANVYFTKPYVEETFMVEIENIIKKHSN